MNIKYNWLVEVCQLNNRAYSKERDKQQLCRQIVFELVQALKFKTNIPDRNLLILVTFLLHDVGGSLPQDLIEDLPEVSPAVTNAAECMRTYLNDVLDFLADFHTLSKIKVIKKNKKYMFFLIFCVFFTAFEERQFDLWTK